jgi:galactokinase
VRREQLPELVVRFREAFGSTEGLMCSRAPGRVNLIGEHTDYNGGFVLPMAVDRETVVLFRPAAALRIRSESLDDWDEFRLAEVAPDPGRHWVNYVRGVAAALLAAGHDLAPVEALIAGDVPMGAGLSSSAALEVACARAFCAAAGVEPDPRELALLCQKAENEFVGVSCGIMDQFVSVHARDSHALLLDCRSLEHRAVPLDGTCVRVIVCNTMVRHDLSASAYNERRASCEEAVRRLAGRIDGVKQLRDVSRADLEANVDVLSGLLVKRARHVVSEDDRTLRAAEALEAADYEQFGRLMYSSHESLRDDYEVSCAELDAMVEAARQQPGVLGARMVGAGFGGSTVNLVRREAVQRFVADVAAEYERRTGIRPDVHECTAVAGARVEPCPDAA